MLIERRSIANAVELARDAGQAGAHLAQAGGAAVALPFYTRAIETYGSVDDPAGLFAVRNDRAIALTNLGRFDEARRDYGACLALASDLRDCSLQFQATMNLGEMERRARNVDLGTSLLRQALAIARDLNDERAEAEALGNLGIALTNAERWDEAKATFRSARDLARRLRAKRAEAVAIGGLAVVALVAGRHAEAARLYRRAITLEVATGDRAHQVEDQAGLVETLAALGDLDAVQVEGQRLVHAAQEIGAERVAANALVRVAHRLFDRGLVDDAAGIFAAAIVGDLVATSNRLDDEQKGGPLGGCRAGRPRAARARGARCFLQPSPDDHR